MGQVRSKSYQRYANLSASTSNVWQPVQGQYKHFAPLADGSMEKMWWEIGLRLQCSTLMCLWPLDTALTRCPNKNTSRVLIKSFLTFQRRLDYRVEQFTSLCFPEAQPRRKRGYIMEVQTFWPDKKPGCCYCCRRCQADDDRLLLLEMRRVASLLQSR